MNTSMARWIAFAGFVLLALPAHAQTFTITGTVASDGQGIIDIPIVLSGEKADTTTTAQNGEFTFADLAAGTYTVTPTDTNYVFNPESLMITFPGTGTPVPVFEASVVATSTEADRQIPTAFVLEQNYPNPFNPETTIQYQVAQAGPVRLDVVDLLGRTVVVLVDDVRGVGTHAVTLDARDLPGGLYLYRLQAGATIRVRKMILAK